MEPLNSSFESIQIEKLERIAVAADVIVRNYWKYINEDAAKEDLKNAVYDYQGWQEQNKDNESEILG